VPFPPFSAHLTRVFLAPLTYGIILDIFRISKQKAQANFGMGFSFSFATKLGGIINL